MTTLQYKNLLIATLAILLFSGCGEHQVEPKTKPIMVDVKPIVIKEKQKESFIWDENISSISQKEYDKALLKYAELKYPQRVKAYKLKLKRARIKREKEHKARIRAKIKKENERKAKIKKENELKAKIEKEKALAKLRWKDEETGLIWQKKIETKVYNWNDAKNYCSHLTLAGYSNWKLPNREEFNSIRIKNSYKNSQSYSGKTYIKKSLLISMIMKYEWFWSATEDNDDSSLAWFVNFDGDFGYYGNKSFGRYVRCVLDSDFKF